MFCSLNSVISVPEFVQVIGVHLYGVRLTMTLANLIQQWTLHRRQLQFCTIQPRRRLRKTNGAVAFGKTNGAASRYCRYSTRSFGGLRVTVELVRSLHMNFWQCLVWVVYPWNVHLLVIGIILLRIYVCDRCLLAWQFSKWIIKSDVVLLSRPPAISFAVQ